MINTQLHNELIEQEIQRKAYAAQKRVQEAKTQVLKERLKQTFYITGFLFIVLLLLIILYWLFPNKTISYYKRLNHVETAKKSDKKSGTRPLNGIEYVKKNNYVYKRVYKDGVLMQEIKLAATITASRKQKHENIPQFATLKKDKDTQ